MEVLDTSIANVALPHIAGSSAPARREPPGCSPATWSPTPSFCPSRGWLSNRIGRKRFYMTCVALFTALLAPLRLAPPLAAALLRAHPAGRWAAAALRPASKPSSPTLSPSEKRGQAFALYGMAVVVAPAIGPTLGGWITDNFNWHWIFFINLPVGLLSLYLSNRIVEDPPFLKERREESKHLRVDFTGLGLVAIGVGLVEFTLDKGQEKDWFGDPLIRTTALLGTALLIFFAWWEWHHPDPIVDLKLLKNRNFGTAVFLQLILGMVLFGSTVLIPQYLQILLGYTAERAGEVLSPAGFVMMAMMAVAGKTLGKMDPRLMVCLAYIGTAAGIYNLSRLDLTTPFHTVMLWRCFQVLSLPFVFIPISTLNYVGVPATKSNQISSLSNFARNLGGSAGTALLTTYLARSAQIHQQTLAAHITPDAPALRLFREHIAELLARNGGGITAAAAAMGQAYQMMLRQASMLSYKNAFTIMGIVVVCLSPLPFLMRLPPKRGPKPPEEAMGH